MVGLSAELFCCPKSSLGPPSDARLPCPVLESLAAIGEGLFGGGGVQDGRLLVNPVIVKSDGQPESKLDSNKSEEELPAPKIVARLGGSIGSRILSK